MSYSRKNKADKKCECGQPIDHVRTGLCSPCYKIKRRLDWKTNEKKRQAADPFYISNRIKNNRKYVKQWQIANRDRIYKKQVERCKSDSNFLLSRILRKRLCEAVKNNQKTGSAVKDLGCSIEEFQQYLESQFTNGMSWENYGEWHIDHIKPLASFNLENRKELLKACHYTNLQPLWARENIRKGDKIE